MRGPPLSARVGVGLRVSTRSFVGNWAAAKTAIGEHAAEDCLNRLPVEKQYATPEWTRSESSESDIHIAYI